MSLINKYEKEIKNLIKQNHESKFYNEMELFSVMHSILLNFKINEVNHENIITSMSHYLYYSCKEEKYYFNLKRKQTKKRIYVDKILISIKDYILVNKKNAGSEDVNVDGDVNGNESIEITSDDLKKIEKKIFEKIKKNSGKNTPEQNNKDEKFKEIDCDIIKEDSVDYSEFNNETDMKLTKKTDDDFGPFGTQWLHDIQVDDEIDENVKKYEKQFDIIRAIVVPEQGTEGWYKMRNDKITASDGGTVIDVNHYEPQYKFILKKTTDYPFLSNEFVHHGKKYEEIATMLYEYRMNVMTEEFGLIGHPLYDFLGASPDRICNKYKLDKIHLSKFIGRMLEIKCPLVRKIHLEGPIIDHICPLYYWVQVQLQLECCDLDECDFWQCEIKEYESETDFIEDTDANEPFRSKEHKYEKGCVIQLLPKNKINDIREGKYYNVVYEKSRYIYPPKIEMSPKDYELWIKKSLEDIKSDPKYNDYFFDKVIYWKLIKSKCVTILRDKKWFEEKLPEFQKMWNYVLFFRENKDKLDILVNYIENMKTKYNKEIMQIVEKIYNVTNPNYNKILSDIIKETEKNKIQADQRKEEKERERNENRYMFIDETEPNTNTSFKPFKKNTFFKTPYKKNINKNDNEDNYMFVSDDPKPLNKKN